MTFNTNVNYVFLLFIHHVVNVNGSEIDENKTIEVNIFYIEHASFQRFRKQSSIRVAEISRGKIEQNGKKKATFKSHF